MGLAGGESETCLPTRPRVSCKHVGQISGRLTDPAPEAMTGQIVLNVFGSAFGANFRPRGFCVYTVLEEH